MPLYEYQCEKCGKLFEVLQRYSDAPLTVHEDCGGAVVKQMSAPGFQFKGSGWYVTDYGKGGVKPEAKSEGKSETKTESTSSDSSAKTESKPASESKSESKPESKPAPATKTEK